MVFNEHLVIPLRWHAKVNQMNIYILENIRIKMLLMWLNDIAMTYHDIVRFQVIVNQSTFMNKLQNV